MNTYEYRKSNAKNGVIYTIIFNIRYFGFPTCFNKIPGSGRRIRIKKQIIDIIYVNVQNDNDVIKYVYCFQF